MRRGCVVVIDYVFSVDELDVVIVVVLIVKFLNYV